MENKKRATKTVMAKRAAVKKHSEKMAQIAFRLEPAIKQKIADHATAIGEPMQRFIIRACINQIAADNAQQRPENNNAGRPGSRSADHGAD